MCFLSRVTYIRATPSQPSPVIDSPSLHPHQSLVLPHNSLYLNQHGFLKGIEPNLSSLILFGESKLRSEQRDNGRSLMGERYRASVCVVEAKLA